MTWKIVGVSKALVIYIYIDNNSKRQGFHFDVTLQSVKHKISINQYANIVIFFFKSL